MLAAKYSYFQASSAEAPKKRGITKGSVKASDAWTATFVAMRYLL